MRLVANKKKCSFDKYYLSFILPTRFMMPLPDNISPTAQVFMSAFKQLPAKERSAFVQALLADTEFSEDLRDISIARERRSESAVSLDEYRQKRSLGNTSLQGA